MGSLALDRTFRLAVGNRRCLCPRARGPVIDTPFGGSTSRVTAPARRRTRGGFSPFGWMVRLALTSMACSGAEQAPLGPPETTPLPELSSDDAEAICARNLARAASDYRTAPAFQVCLFMWGSPFELEACNARAPSCERQSKAALPPNPESGARDVCAGSFEPGDFDECAGFTLADVEACIGAVSAEVAAVDCEYVQARAADPNAPGYFNPYEITGACDELFDRCFPAQELVLGW